MGYEMEQFDHEQIDSNPQVQQTPKRHYLAVRCGSSCRNWGLLDDKYARYLSDIFYLPGSKNPERVCSQGQFLNQELLDKGLAKLWSPV